MINRAGRASGFLAMGLFLLSCLIVLPALRWTYHVKRADDVASRRFRFREEFHQVAPDHTAVTELTQPQIKAWHFVNGLESEIAQFETVFWEPDDTNSLRAWLTRAQLKDADVLEIGTGTGLVSLICATRGASLVVATDINVSAFANARYNAQHLELETQIEVRLVSESEPAPFAVIEPDEQFDLILSNPPWEDAPVAEPAAYALYDPGFALLDGILADAHTHLKPGGRLLLAYGAKTAIERILETAPANGWDVELADERRLVDVPEVFVPGMLLVLTRSEP